jgi:hypothetical protein
MDITVNVGDVDFNTTFDDGYNSDGEPNARTLGSAVAARIFGDVKRELHYGEFRKLVDTIRAEEIRKAVAAQVHEAMVAPIQQTNGFGEPVGKAMTLREMVVAEAHRFFTVRTGDYNKPHHTDAERAVASMVHDLLTKELAGIIAEEKTKVVAAVQAKAGSIIAEAVKAGLR